MPQTLHLAAVGFAILAVGLVAGVFLAFSDFVMRSLALIPPRAGSEAMQVLNREVYRSVFIVLLIGMSLGTALLGLHAFFRVEGPAMGWIVAGSLIYLFATFTVTMVFNVPMNKTLDAMDPAAAETATYWAVYVRDWTFWNTVRTIAPTLTVICYLMAFVHLARA